VRGPRTATTASEGSLRLAPYDGDATYRMIVRHPDGSFAPSVAIPAGK
jgi:hypothetical protein